jgi:thiazole/oxazole-forming peptide maturase SagD family component
MTPTALARLSQHGDPGEVEAELERYGLPLSFSFTRDEYEFHGPTMLHRWQCCPHCILLYAATDARMVEAVASGPLHREPGQARQAEMPWAGYVKIVPPEGEPILARATECHPLCRVHDGAESPPYGAVDSVQEAASRLEDAWLDPWIGVIRFEEELASSEGKRLGEVRHMSAVAFANPAFPHNPRAGFLEFGFGIARRRADARASALMECAERFSVLTPPRHAPSAAGAASSLGHRALAPELLPRYSEAQLRSGRGFENATADTSLEWETTTTLRQENLLVPRHRLYSNPLSASCFGTVSSSGSAARTGLASARAHAAFELLERDAVLRHWLSGDVLDHIVGYPSDSPLGEISSELGRRGHRLALLDCTSQGSLTVVVAVATAAEADWPDTLVTSAAHPEPAIAALRAAEEAYASFVLSFVSSEARHEPESSDQVLRPADHVAFYRGPGRRSWLSHYREPKETVAYSRWVEQTPLPTADLEADPIALDQFLTAAGFSASFHDQTAPGLRPLGIHVSRCFAPEAVPMAFGAGAVYQVIPRAPLAALAADLAHRPHPFG